MVNYDDYSLLVYFKLRTFMLKIYITLRFYEKSGVYFKVTARLCFFGRVR